MEVSFLSALFKSGPKLDANNYRPISLTCILCKVFESIIRDNLVTFLDDKLNINQHGFIKGKSCLTNLLETFECILELFEEGAPVDLIYFDFKKAFDQVPHKRLILKLKMLGIGGKLLGVIEDFLTNRTFRVCVEGKLSSLMEVLSGIPQGSVLGPLLFLIFINDLPDNLKCFTKLFADDLKLIGNASNRYDIDEDLRTLEFWEKDWFLGFNYDKCKVMHLNYNDNKRFEYKLDGHPLEVSALEKDLGVLTSDTLLWTEQINASISKANKLICWIARNWISRDRFVMIRIYKTLIRPHLEQCVQLWNPAVEHGNWSLILRLEGVQRRYTRLIDEVGLLPYSKRLDLLELTTLVERRARGDLIEVYKAKHGFTKLNGVFKFGKSKLNILSSINVNDSSSICKLKRNYINERVRNFWNKLPSYVKNSQSVNSFKNNLDKCKYVCLSLGGREQGHFWEVSFKVLDRIENNNYLLNKEKHNSYLKLNPYVAKKKFINIF